MNEIFFMPNPFFNKIPTTHDRLTGYITLFKQHSCSLSWCMSVSNAQLFSVIKIYEYQDFAKKITFLTALDAHYCLWANFQVTISKLKKIISKEAMSKLKEKKWWAKWQ